jgi:TrmH family RNA methyltransferase
MPVTKSQVKYIQSLGHKKFRDTEGVFVVEGPKLVGELLQEPAIRPRVVYALGEWARSLPPAQRAIVTEVGEGDLGRLSGLTSPNQVVAIVEKPVFPPPVWNKGVHLVLDGIQDPGNLGTIVRLADWFGIGTVLCTPDSADVFNPKAVQSTMGSIARIPVIYTDAAAIIGTAGLPVYAALLDGENMYRAGRVSTGFIVVGNESKGISPEIQALATHRVTIPRIGQAESLNAAVATGIILSHLVGASVS